MVRRKNINLNEKHSHTKPLTIAIESTKLDSLISGELSLKTLTHVTTIMIELLSKVDYIYYHKGYATIEPSAEIQEFINSSNGLFSYGKFGSKKGTLVLNSYPLGKKEQQTYLAQMSSPAGKKALETIFTQSNILNSELIEKNISSDDQMLIDIIIKLLEVNLAKINEEFTTNNGTLIQDITQKEILITNSLNNLKPYFNLGSKRLSQEQIESLLENGKCTPYEFFILLATNKLAVARTQKYSYQNGTLYINTYKNSLPKHELDYLGELVPEEKQRLELLLPILTKADQQALNSLRHKSVGISSGKGGVGKTIITTNLATHFASLGLRVGIIDVDPLSDIATLLDLKSFENIAKEKTAGLKLKYESLQEHIIDIGKNFDLIFPRQKLTDQDRGLLLEKIFVQYAKELDNNYDIILFDLPAGNEFKDNLIYQDFIKHILLVTNPEPTAHMSTGGYLKSTLDIDKNRIENIFLIHNKMTNEETPEFNKHDIIKNYNKLSPDESKLAEHNKQRLQTLGDIPETTYLKINLNNPQIESLLAGLIKSVLIGTKTQNKDNQALTSQLRIVIHLLDQHEYQKANKELAKVIGILNATKNNGVSILMIYYSLQKLNIATKVASYIPKRKVTNGGTIRDRHQQIVDLLAGENKSGALAEKLMPLLLNQLKHLEKLGLKIPESSVSRKVLEDFCEEALYSGLGILTPLTIRSAAQEFRKIAETLQEVMEISAP